MPATLPTASASLTVPSTKAWLLLLGLLTSLLVVGHRAQPGTGAPAVVAGRDLPTTCPAPRRVALESAVRQPTATAAFGLSTAL